MSEASDESVVNEETERRDSRRRFLKRAAYVAPILVTLAAAPAFAQAGSSPPISCPPGSVPVFLPGIGWQCLT